MNYFRVHRVNVYKTKQLNSHWMIRSLHVVLHMLLCMNICAMRAFSNVNCLTNRNPGK